MTDTELWRAINKLGDDVSELRTHQAVIDERVGTLVKFVDRLVNAVYAAAGSIFLASVAVLIFQRGIVG